MGTFIQDLRYGLRMLVKAPGFTAVAVLSLTLGIGANTTIFTLAKAVFLHSVPVKNPSRVMMLYSTAQDRSGPLQQYLGTPYPNALDYQKNLNSFSGISISFGNGFGLIISGQKTQVPGQLVSGNFFDVLGVAPVLGRGFSPDDESSRRPVTVLSYELWKTRFGGDPKVIGKVIQLDQMEYSVIGVARAVFAASGNLVVRTFGYPSRWRMRF